jgi:hypothetical protein
MALMKKKTSTKMKKIKNIQEVLLIPLKNEPRQVVEDRTNCLMQIILRTEDGYIDGGRTYSVDIMTDKTNSFTPKSEDIGTDAVVYYLKGYFDYNPAKKTFMRNKIKTQ